MVPIAFENQDAAFLSPDKQCAIDVISNASEHGADPDVPEYNILSFARTVLISLLGRQSESLSCSHGASLGSQVLGFESMHRIPH